MELEALADLGKLLGLLKKLKDLRDKKKRIRSCSVREINRTRNIHGYYKVTFLKIKELDSIEFFAHTRMNGTAFKMLYNLVRVEMESSDRILINTECRLALTLLYLSQGTSLSNLALNWKLGKETVRCIIYETCESIWNVIGPLYVSEPTINGFSKISKDFWELWNFPNCLGAIGGKHIALQSPPGTGNQDSHCKRQFSLVLMAVCDARYSFTYIDVGGYGSRIDEGIYDVSDFGRKLNENKLNIPLEKNLPGTNSKLPQFFVGDAAFTLSRNLMKPYTGIGLSNEQENFNKSLNRAQGVIENSFGILACRWRILLTTLSMLPENAEKVIFACVALHNFLRSNLECEHIYTPPQFVDWIDDAHELHEGLWRKEIQTPLQSITHSNDIPIVEDEAAAEVRNRLSSFVNNIGLDLI